MRPGAPWCTQCWSDLRPPPPETEPRAPLQAALADAAALEGTALRAAGGGWPCSACGERNPVDVDACTGCGTGLFAAMRAGQEPLLSLPGVGDLTRFSRAQRLGLAGAVALAFVLLVLVVGLLSG